MLELSARHRDAGPRWSFIFALLWLLLAWRPEAVLARDAGGGSLGQAWSELPGLLRAYERRAAAAMSEAAIPAGATSPTLSALRGLQALKAGDIAAARGAADLLLADGEQRGEGLFFPFRWSYEVTWPYLLRAPWVSALSQGLALALLDALGEATDDDRYRRAARRVARSFLVEVGHGGVLRQTPDGPALEEYPVLAPTHVLNGAAIATLALLDHLSRNPDSALSSMVEASKGWWRANIDRYTVWSDQYAAPVSAYSLAPQRHDVLFRFWGGAGASVSRITLVLDGQRVDLHVGAPGDDSRTARAYVWSNPQFMNWSARRDDGNTPVRDIAPGQGAYNHAPFSFAADPASINPGDARLEVEFLRVLDGGLNVQILDGEQWHNVIAAIPAGGRMQLSAPLPAAAIAVLRRNRSVRPPPVEPAYFVDNEVLVRHLGMALQLRELTDASALWRASRELTPSRFDPRTFPALVEPVSDAPVIRLRPVSPESAHVEYPSVLRRADRVTMAYAAIGEDRRWRLFLASSTDEGATWTRHGAVFGDDDLAGLGAIAFPALARDPRNGRFVLFFAADANGDGVYDRILSAESEDMRNWRRTDLLLNAQGLGLKLAARRDGGWSLSYAEAGPQGFNLVERVSPDLARWTASRMLLSIPRDAGRGLYTHDRFSIGEAEVWIIDRTLAPGRLAWELRCQDRKTARLLPVLGDPIHVSDPGGDRWDQHRYGMNVFRSPDGLRLLYNGIRLDRGDGHGMIGLARLRLPPGLESRLPAACR